MSVEWFAGLYEGEGNISARNRGITLSISSTDLDVLQKVQSIMNGRIKGPRHDGNPKHKPRWEWYVTSRNEVMDVCDKILPYLCQRRKEQINKAIGGRSRLPSKRELVSPILECNIDPNIPTTSGAKRHTRKGEKPCVNCASAYRLYLQNWRKANP